MKCRAMIREGAQTGLAVLGTSFCILGCDLNNKKIDVNEAHAPSEVKVANDNTEMLCFKKEYRFKDNPDAKDVQQLSIIITGDTVQGTYDWVPAFKDKRKGNFRGSIHNDTIEAIYAYSQEGVNDTVPVLIVLTGKKALIEGGEASLGLDASLDKIPCQY